MIVFDLECRSGGHRFEGWFGSSEDFARQQERGLVACPQCGSGDVIKAPMAPHLARKGNQRAQGVSAPVTAMPEAVATAEPAPVQAAPPSPVALPPKLQAAFMHMAQLQAEALKQSRWVGPKFAEDVRAMHYGDKEAEAIHGQVSPDEARDLIDEGIEVAPVLFPVAAPGDVN